MDTKAKLSNKKKILLVAVIVAAVVVALLLARLPDSETVTYKDAKAGAVTMEQTLTAAGEIKAASSEEIEFSTSKYFSGMCVEEGDAVREGQHLISYSDGTYDDAPNDGVVTSIDAPETGSAGDGDNAVTLSYTDELVLEISVPEDEISKVSKGDEAKVTVNADTSKTFNGTISSVKAMSASQLSSQEDADSDEEDTDSASTDSDAGASGASGKSGGQGFGGSMNGSSSESSTAYYTVAMKLTNDGTLKPGMSGNCTITVSSRRSVLAVPIEAVQFDDEDKAYVNVVNGNSVKKTLVTTGESDANYVEITDGLSDGDTVQIEVRQ